MTTKILSALPFSKNEVQNLPNSYWDEFFTRWLPDYNQAKSKSAEVARLLNYSEHELLYWWDKLSSDLNPIAGAIMTRKLAPNLHPDIFFPSTDVSDSNKLIPHPELRNILEQKINDAATRNCTIAAIMLSADTTDGSGLFFGSTRLPETNEIVPTNFLVPSQYYSTDGLEQWLTTTTRQLKALTFFEGLRQQIAQNQGLRCPLWRDGQCCQLNDLVSQLWKSGHKARDKSNISFKKWEKPACLSDS
jgi:hypothetical protein